MLWLGLCNSSIGPNPSFDLFRLSLSPGNIQGQASRYYLDISITLLCAPK